MLEPNPAAGGTPWTAHQFCAELTARMCCSITVKVILIILHVMSNQSIKKSWLFQRLVTIFLVAGLAFNLKVKKTETNLIHACLI